jgi:TIR domain-containing protein
MREVKASASKRKRPFRVFLSHAPGDAALARKIRNLLIRHSSSSVFTNADLSAGENWQSKLQKELETADVFVALLTPESVASSWVLQETGAAWALDKPIIPLVTRLDILDRFPIQLRGYNAFELQNLDTPEGSEQFAAALEHTLAASHPM